MEFYDIDTWYEKVGWIGNPFVLDIIPALMVGHKNEIEKLLKNINESQKFILITGPTGSGKTTIMKYISDKYQPIYLPKPPKEFNEFVDIFKNTIIKPTFFDLIFKKDSTTVYTLADEINKRHRGKKILFLVDEAHETDISVLEWLRAIIDQIDGATLVLAGLPVFKETHLVKLETLRQRITFEMDIRTLNREDILELIKKRVESVGGENLGPFTYDVINEIYEQTGGFPREVIKMCNELVQVAIDKKSIVIDSTFFERKSEVVKTKDISNCLDTLTDKQKEIIEIIAKSDGMTPTEIVKAINPVDYKSQIHALRALNNILKRLESTEFISREKRGRSFKYKVSPKIKNRFIEA